MEKGDLITVEEAAEILGYHTDHVYRLLRQKRLEGQKFGNGWVVSVSSVAEVKARQDDSGRVLWDKGDR